MNFEEQRRVMIEEQLEDRGISDQRVLDAMSLVPREIFVPEDIRNFAYYDGPLPLDWGQSLSQPFIVAYMAEMLDLPANGRVLEVGAGSGYNAAVLALMAKEVFTIEVNPPLFMEAKTLLEALGFSNIHLRLGDGSSGWPEEAPFDAIVITAAMRAPPLQLLEQLKDPGKLIVPEGDEHQFLFLYEKKQGKIEKNMLIPVRFGRLIEGDSGEQWDRLA